MNSAADKLEAHAPLELNDDEVRAMLVAIGNATGNDYAEAPESEHAALTVALSRPPSPGGENRVVVSVTNRGPDPAYRVVAHLKIVSTMSREITLPFGRINRGETRTATKDLGAVSKTDELNPNVEASISSSNAAPASWNGKIRLTAKGAHTVPPQLSCSTSDKIPAADQRLRIECEVSNPGGDPMQGLTYQIAIDKAEAETAKGPSELAPYAQTKFELAPMLPANAQVGSSVGITVTMKAPGESPVQQQIVVEPATATERVHRAHEVGTIGPCS